MVAHIKLVFAHIKLVFAHIKLVFAHIKLVVAHIKLMVAHSLIGYSFSPMLGGLNIQTTCETTAHIIDAYIYTYMCNMCIYIYIIYTYM